ncbi:MAG: glycosyltransferase family protein [bacterium]
MKTVVIIQARMTSMRLSGKVLKNISGKPLLWHVIQRVKLSKHIDNVILAIPDTKENDILEKFSKDNNIKYFRGNEEDVLFRYYETAKKYGAELIVRITSDCPLIDPKIIDKVIQIHKQKKVDYTSIGIKRTFPRGVDVEVFDFETLNKAHQKASKKEEREHVTLYIYTHPKIFKIQNIKAEKHLHHPELRICVDTKEDLELVQKIYKYLYKNQKIFYTEDVVNLLVNQHPELQKINQNIKQKKVNE